MTCLRAPAWLADRDTCLSACLCVSARRQAGRRQAHRQAGRAEGTMRLLDIRRDIDGICALAEVAFADEIARRGVDLRHELRQARRMIPLVSFLRRFSEFFRYLMMGYVWEIDGRIAAAVLFHRQGNDRSRWYISTVATHPEHRRQGLARRLIERSIERARELGGKVYILDVRADNPPAYNLYQSLGFVHYDSHTELKLETWPDVKAEQLSGYTLRPLNLAEWKARFDLALRETSTEAQAFMPLSEAQYRLSWLQRHMESLMNRLQRIHVQRWAVEEAGSVGEGKIVATLTVRARQRAKNPHGLGLCIDPAHREALAEPLLRFALQRLQQYPPQKILTDARTSETALLELFKSYGFVELDRVDRLGMKLAAQA